MKAWRIVLPVLAVLVCAAGPQDKEKKGEGHDYVTNTIYGFRLYKPPKTDKWEVKGQGTTFRDTQASVSNKAKKLTVEVAVTDVNPKAGLIWPPVSAVATQVISSIRSKALRLKVRKNEAAKLPSRKKENAQYVEMEVTREEEQTLIERRWIFYAQANQNLFQIIIVGDDKDYEKYEKDIKIILYLFQTLKVKR